MGSSLFSDPPGEQTARFRHVVDSSYGPFFSSREKQSITTYSEYAEGPGENVRHAPYVSFGDQSITASAGAFGSIFRINQYIGRKDFQSRILGLDCTDHPEAYYVCWRAMHSQANASEATYGLGIRFPDNSNIPRHNPTLSFLNYRWPLIKYTVGRLDFEVRLICFDTTVFQHVRVTNTSLETQKLELVLDPRLYMRDVDYTTADRENLPIVYRKGPHDHSVVITEKQSNTNTGQEDAQQPIHVVIGLFENGISQPIGSTLAEGEDSVVQPIPIVRYIKGENNRVDLIAAVKVSHSTASSNWKDFVIGGSHMNLALDRVSVSIDHTSEPISGYSLALNWLLRRNLEHILSVCSLVTQKPERESHGLAEENVEGPVIFLERGDSTRELLHGTNPEEDTVREIGLVAITCGDFGDHRVSVSGSYFAFNFMLEMYKLLLKTTALKGSDAPELCRRIRETCKGHLRWIKMLDADKASSSNIWVNGSVISNEQQTDIPQDSPTNMPYHILKVMDYLRVFGTRDDLIFVCTWLGTLVKSWVNQLQKTRNRLSPTWAHPTSSSDIPVYRLSDHVWVWKALTDIEELIETVRKHDREVPHSAFQDFLEVESCLPSRKARRPASTVQLDFTVDEMKRQNLRRFTLENEILRKRMLSVTRTARETRFLFHARDTVLYYGKEWHFFRDQDEIWTQLVNAQPQHDQDENDEARWDNALRYGLAIVMSASHNKLDRSFEPHEMYNHAKNVIMQSSSENGLFPGQLEPSTKDPVVFDQEVFRDFYFHCGFELPFILLQYVPKFENTTLGVRTSPTVASDAEDKPKGLTSAPVDFSLSRRNSTLPGVLNTTMIPMDGFKDLPTDRRFAVVAPTLKQKNPYGKLVDLSNIVEVPEEWLYKYPDFLDFEPPQRDSDYKSIIENAPTEMTDALSDEDTGDDSNPRYTFIEDIKKGRKQRKFKADEKSDPKTFASSQALLAHLKARRMVETAKKRFIYLPSLDKARAKICYFASPETERTHIAQFFDRHGRYGAYFYDDTSLPSNSWVTEMHFRFYQVQDRKGQQAPSPQARGRSGRRSLLSPNFQLTPAMISFRIVGDFFDRYWTCHLVEKLSSEALNLNDIHGEAANWHQRKVLELILFCRILKNVGKSARAVLDVEEGPPLETLDIPHGDTLDHFEEYGQDDLRRYLRVLLSFRNNLSRLQELIDQWNGRESTQGRGRPRWTRNDEQKYRKAIKHHQATLERHARNLKTKQAQIEIFITRVTTAQEAIRSNKSLREAENITLFTYVTVFFLPVGLAVSIFSMGDVPEHNVVVLMAITAVVALVITASTLYLVLRHITILQGVWKFVRNISLQNSGPPAQRSQGGKPGLQGLAGFLHRSSLERDHQHNKNDPEQGQPGKGLE